MVGNDQDRRTFYLAAGKKHPVLENDRIVCGAIVQRPDQRIGSTQPFIVLEDHAYG